ncbi:MAG: Crp/Fnr family transcriptional regulator [Campylobacterota bacterium]
MSRFDPKLLEGGLFSHLSVQQIEKIEAISSLKCYESGEIIFYEGDESRHFHLLLEGEASIFKTSASTETIVVHRFRAPSLIAEVATLKQVPFPASAEAVGTAAVLKIERERFLSLLREDPSLSITMIASLTQKIGALEASLQRHSAPNASAKVARLILEDADAFRRLKGIEIAALLAITPETLSRTLKKFKTLSLISYQEDRRLFVDDPRTLQGIADNNFPLRESLIK